MSIDSAVKGLAVLSAIPAVLLAIWADYFSRAIDELGRKNPYYDRAAELYKVRMAGLCAIFFQFGIFMGTGPVRADAPVAATGIFIIAVVVQAIVQASLERKLRSQPAPRLRAVPTPSEQPSSDEPTPAREMDLAMRAFFWATLGGALYLGSFAFPVVVTMVLGKWLNASQAAMTVAVITAAIVGMGAGVGLNFALAAVYLRNMLPTRLVEPGELRNQLEDAFKRGQVDCPSLWTIELGRRREATALLAGIPGGRGWFKPGLFLSRSLVDALNVDELRAVTLHEVAHMRLKHLKRRLAYAVALILGTTAAATFCVFLATLYLPDGDLRSMVGMVAAVGAFGLTFTRLGSQSRAHELEADAHSVQALGADMEALISALKKLDQINGRSAGPLATHPPTEQRIEALKTRFGHDKPADSQKRAA